MACTHNKDRVSAPQDRLKVIASEPIQHVIDSIVNLHIPEDSHTYELFVDKGSEYITYIIFHIGKTSYYESYKLSPCYMVSCGVEINIYSGIESYFNVSRKPINYGNSMDIILQSKEHLLWGILMYKDCLLTVSTIKSARPFILYPDIPYFELPKLSCPDK
jgi:hypothetical protein